MAEAGAEDQLRLRLGRLARHAEAEAARRSRRSMLDLPAALPDRLPRRRAIRGVSQLYHGEILTARLCARLARQVPLAEARDCLELQRQDEVAHAGLYAAYLDELGGTAPRHAVLGLLEHELEAWRGLLEATILAVHLLLEGEAVVLQSNAESWLPCKRFHLLNAQIAQDEGRHIAFGKLYLPKALAAVGQPERLAIQKWLHALWWRAFTLIYRDHGLASLIVEPALHLWARQRWRHWQRELRRVGLYDDSERRLFESA